MGLRTNGRLRDSAIVLAAWTVIVVAVLAVGWLITHPLASSIDPWDDDASRWFASHRDGTLTDAADAATFLGETWVGMAISALLAGAFALWQRSVRPAVFFALLVAGIGGIYGLATVLISRQRPPVEILDPGLVPNDSYPSGHVGTAIAVYVGTAVLLWWYAARTRPWGWALALIPFLVALSRLYLGAHHLTDVLVTACYATAWLAVVTTLVLRSADAPAVPGAQTDPRAERQSV